MRTKSVSESRGRKSKGGGKRNLPGAARFPKNLIRGVRDALRRTAVGRIVIDEKTPKIP